MLMNNLLCFVTTQTQKRLRSRVMKMNVRPQVMYDTKAYSLMLKVLQITSIARLSVSELSEAVRVSCGSFDQRKREGDSPGRGWPRIAAPLPLWHRFLSSAAGAGRGNREVCGEERGQTSTVQYCTAQYCTVHCQLALLLCQGKVVSGSAAAGAKCTQTHSQLQSAFNDFLGGSALA